jgi:hypothetical protein
VKEKTLNKDKINSLSASLVLFILIGILVLTSYSLIEIKSPEKANFTFESLSRILHQGEITIHVRHGNMWQRVGVMNFNEHTSIQTIRIKNPPIENNELTVRITRRSISKVRINSIHLDGLSPMEVLNLEDKLKTSASQVSDDNEILKTGRTSVIKFRVDKNKDLYELNISAETENE